MSSARHDAHRSDGLRVNPPSDREQRVGGLMSDRPLQQAQESGGSVPAGESWVIRHGGREFYTTAEMATIFRRQAERILASGDHELVVLRHSRGVDMVLIAGESSFSVIKAGAAVADRSAAAG